MLRLTLALALLSLVVGTKCPSQQLCGDQQTCCQVQSSGEYNCCPFHQGECCEDHLHCCPEGMLCQTPESKCTNSTHSLPWTERISTKKTDLAKSFRMISSSVASKDNIICPDNTSCPAEFSCLKLFDRYSCCPVTQGIVCTDGKHCCPNDHECTVDSTSCVKKKEPVRAVMCADGVSECPVQTSCCETADGWGCCPMPRAVCCADKVHCCPEDSVCHVNSSKCVTSTKQELPMWAKFPARLRADWEDRKPEAVTPKMTTKQLETSTTSRSTAATTTTTTTAVSKGADVPCNDTVACPDGDTCCKNAQGGWGCCPLSEAVCCDDFVHCCPHGKKCNVAAGTCEDPSGSEPWLEKNPSLPIRGRKLPKMKGADVPCNDTVACPEGDTCCKNAQGGWGCCPLSEAVCCDDFVHCCPHGKKCNVAAGTCEDPSGSEPWLEKNPSLPIRGRKLPKTKGADVPCNDTVACPDGDTCCKNAQGDWGCCPLSEAVCCDDFVHCCPHGKKCNVAAGTCEDPSGSEPWLEKKPSQPIRGSKPLDKVKGQSTAANVSCDSSHSCPPSSTCCKDVEADWGCCPFAQGVCCKDHLHCCPHETTCNFRTLTCDKGNISVPMAMIVKAFGQPAQKKEKEEVKVVKKPKENERNGSVQCDERHSCPDDTTCCFVSKTQKCGCCLLPNAVCCKDGEHCCPEQYKCDSSQTSCIKGDVVIPWYTKVAAESSPDQSSVRCDSQTSCPIGATCCRLGTGKWGCCPLPEATCCPDREHCCPKGYMCDEDSKSCVKTILLQVETVPLTHIRHLHNDIQCGGGFTCKDTEACCKTSRSTWGCCPFAKAVCCSDMKHCCPAGYTCGEGGVCTQTTGFNWDHWQVFFSRKKRALLV